MPNIELLEKSMPVAPIRIAALEGCRDLAEEVDRKLVKFRKELVEKKGLNNIPQGYSEKSFLVDCECPVLVLVRARESLRNLSAVQTFTLW